MEYLLYLIKYFRYYSLLFLTGSKDRKQTRLPDSHHRYKKVDKQLTHAMHVKDRHVNDTFIDKLTKWYQ